MKCLFIINPSSGTGTIQRQLDRIIGQLVLHGNVSHIDTYYTKRKDDALEKCASLKKGDYDFVVSVGGDGTVNEVMTGLNRSQSGIPCAILPGGTVNDFATYLELPTRPKDFAKMIRDFHTINIDLGEINEQCFVNVCSGGMFSDVAFQVTKEDKKNFGPLAYYVSGFVQLPQQLATNLHLTIEADGAIFEDEAALFMITNTSHVGGFAGITPQASVQDGKLDLIIIKKAGILEYMNVIASYGFNNHETNPYITYIQANHLKIDCDQDIVYDIDGEMGKGFPIEVNCLHHAVNLLVPYNTASKER
ncbi:MAG: diacylglycerol/lipid kinase family protein [bacterium]